MGNASVSAQIHHASVFNGTRPFSPGTSNQKIMNSIIYIIGAVVVVVVVLKLLGLY